MENLIKVLAVDDDPNILQMLTLYLKKEGYEVLQADNGQDAYDLAVKEQPFLIISDCMMPVMDGLEFSAKIKENPDTKNILFVLLTGKGTSEDIVTGLDSGADDYIVKPFKAKELMARVRAYKRIAYLQKCLESANKKLKEDLVIRKQLEEKMKQEEKMQGVFEMAATTCHEFNQPLQVISSYAQLLLMSIEDVDLKDMVNGIIESVVRTKEISSKIKNITRYETMTYCGDTLIIDLDKASE